MKTRGILMAVVVLVVTYVGAYGVIRATSFSTGKDTILLGASEDDLHLMIAAPYGSSQQERASSDRIRWRMKLYGSIFVPLCWLDQRLTGSRIEHGL